MYIWYTLCYLFISHAHKSWDVEWIDFLHKLYQYPKISIIKNEEANNLLVYNILVIFLIYYNMFLWKGLFLTNLENNYTREVL